MTKLQSKNEIGGIHNAKNIIIFKCYSKLFQNVFFINGTAYARKSTRSKILSEKYNSVCCGENYNEKLFYLMVPVH